MQSIKYINFVEIGAIVFKIQKAEIGEILVRVNNTLVYARIFLAARHTTCLDIDGAGATVSDGADKNLENF